MARDEVLHIMGKPDEVERLDVPAETTSTTIWLYTDFGVELSFDEDVDFRLARITLLNPEAELLEVRPIGFSEHQLCRMYPDGEMVYSVGDMREFRDAALDVSFWVRDGRVVNFSLFPHYVANGNLPCWPDGR